MGDTTAFYRRLSRKGRVTNRTILKVADEYIWFHIHIYIIWWKLMCTCVIITLNQCSNILLVQPSFRDGWCHNAQLASPATCHQTSAVFSAAKYTSSKGVKTSHSHLCRLISPTTHLNGHYFVVTIAQHGGKLSTKLPRRLSQQVTDPAFYSPPSWANYIVSLGSNILRRSVRY